MEFITGITVSTTCLVGQHSLFISSTELLIRLDYEFPGMVGEGINAYYFRLVNLQSNEVVAITNPEVLMALYRQIIGRDLRKSVWKMVRPWSKIGMAEESQRQTSEVRSITS